MAARMCDVCGVRPATVTIRRIVPGGQTRIEHLCEIHAAEARGQRSSFGRSPLGGGSLFDDFFSRFFDTPEGGGVGEPTRRTTSPRSRAEQVDITQFFSDSTSALLQRAAQRASEWESLNLDDEHLLHAALEDRVVRRVLVEADADPDQIRSQLEEEAERGGGAEASLELSPEAKRALLAAYEESQALGASYIGPEHVLLALVKDEESEAGKLLRRFGLSHTKLRGAVVRGVDKGGEAREPASSTPTLDEYSRDLTQMAKEGKLDPVIG
ncbi:MAG: ATP-dependent Clp protease ATP-binding subunit, partial [Actinomycetota bacterium]|nr:ATP-dependent Clp protease ATP-binding subunit [Actinomycetota bacterium]